MNKLIFVIAGIACSLTVSAQQIPNSDFENWENEGAPTVEPLHWSSLKTADALASAAPTVMFQDPGRTGNYGVKLKVSAPVFGIQANGIITNGRVHADYTPSKGYVYTNASDPQWNTPFTYRPDSVVGWYKYSPKPGDKGSVEMILHTGTHAQLPPDQATIDHEVARAKLWMTSATSTWKRFTIPFIYNNSTQPDYLLAVISAGDSTLSITGTTLWVDDIHLVYNDTTMGVSHNPLDNCEIFNVKKTLHFRFPSFENATYKVYSLEGKILQKGKVVPSVELNKAPGIYIVKVKQNGWTKSQKVYIY